MSVVVPRPPLNLGRSLSSGQLRTPVQTMIGRHGMIPTALAQTWARLSVRFLAVLLTYGALMHVGNVVG